MNWIIKNIKFMKNYSLDECFQSLQEETNNNSENIKKLINMIEAQEAQIRILKKKIQEKTKIIFKEEQFKQIIKQIKNE